MLLQDSKSSQKLEAVQDTANQAFSRIHQSVKDQKDLAKLATPLFRDFNTRLAAVYEELGKARGAKATELMKRLEVMLSYSFNWGTKIFEAMEFRDYKESNKRRYNSVSDRERCVM